MQCPNRKCRKVVTRIVILALRSGRLVRGCGHCIENRRHRIRTNRKVWPSYEVYGVDKTIEKNHQWAENLERKAGRMRRTAHHSFFIN